jgi:two-component system OmpR family sensor kinase
MSIRLRLVWYYSSLFALILSLVMLLSYAVHARGVYDSLDQTLLVSVNHAAAEATSGNGEPHLIQGRNALELALRLFNAHGVLEEQTAGTETLPSIDPRTVLSTPAPPVYDVVSQLVPPILSSPAPPDPGGAFGLLQASGQRWRVYVLTLHRAGTLVGYIEAVAPLGQLDSSLQALHLFLPMLGLISLALGLFGSWAIAGKALRPIATMISTAQAIALSRDLSQRVRVPPHHQDELGRLAVMFNEMLSSIETAYRAQQRFVADASHELRAPLTAIQGNLELLNRHRSMPEAEHSEAIAETTREADRLTRLVADLLALARADAGVSLKHRLIDLDAIVLDAFRLARQLAHGQRLVLKPFEPVQIKGNEDRLKQLLLILLDNALKYTPAGGQVTLGLVRKATGITITVRDTGLGIAPEDLPHVFERFYRADPGRSRDPGGTGLGLSLAQWIAQQHSGTITLESQLGQGTLAVVRLPLPPELS